MSVEGGAVGEADAVVFEVFDWVFELELADVEPCEVGGLHGAEGDLWEFLLDVVVGGLVVVFEVGE